MEVGLNNMHVGAGGVPGTVGPSTTAAPQHEVGSEVQKMATDGHQVAGNVLGFADSYGGAISNSDKVGPPTDESLSHMPKTGFSQSGMEGVRMTRRGGISESPSARRGSISKLVGKLDEKEQKVDLSNRAWGVSVGAAAGAQVAAKVATGATSKASKAAAGLGAASAFFDSVAVVAGTVSTGVTLFKTIKLKNEIRTLQKQLKEAPPSDPELKANLERQINEKKSQTGSGIKASLFRFLANVSWCISSAVNLVVTFSKAVVHGASIIGAVFGGIVYGTVSAAVKIKDLYDDFKEIRSVRKEIKLCDAKLKDPNLSTDMKEIYGARKLCLEEKVISDLKLRRKKNFVDLGCSLLSVAQGIVALTATAAAPWLAIPLAVGVGTGVAMKIAMDKKSQKADQKVNQALQQSVASADFNHKGPDGVAKEFTDLTKASETPNNPRASTEEIATKAANDPGMAELKALVAKEMGISDVSQISAKDIAAWTLKSPAPQDDSGFQGAPVITTG